MTNASAPSDKKLPLIELCKFFRSTGEHWLSKLSTNHNGVLPGFTVNFDWVKVSKAGALVLPKNLQFRRLVCKTGQTAQA